MGGGLIQLVSLGIQDEYLTGNPQITFFKTVYRRHSNFAIETIEQVIDGVKDTEEGETIGVVTVSRNGDLLKNVYVSCDQNNYGIRGNKLIKEVELVIGGTLIDKHTGEWLDIYSELYTPESKKEGFKYMTGGYDNNFDKDSGGENIQNFQNKIIIPLRFFFCNEDSQALPLIALQYHDIMMKFKWGFNSEINRKEGNNDSVSCEVWCDYIFLDGDERKRFAESTHEYLIEQLQFKEYTQNNRSFDLTFNHPVKSLFWTEKDLISSQKASIVLNGSERFYKQSKEYFQLKQPYEHFTSIPGINIKERDTLELINPIPVTYNQIQEVDSMVSSNKYAYTWEVSSNFNGEHPSRRVMINSHITDSIPTQIYSTITFEHDMTIQYPLNLEIGDILMVSISLKDPDTAGEDLGQNSISFMTNIKEIENNNVNPGNHTIIKVYPNFGITINNDNVYIVSMDVIGRYTKNKSRTSNLKKNINCYSFALNPEEHQPSGTCNFSKIDDIKLVFDDMISSNYNNPLTIYALNYNVLRIKNGMGGLAYSN